ncbi:MAG: glutamine synthetase III [Flavobacteriales bacterium]|nr:glutamine synthetase III [Flavobacteriales bacterium]
MRFKAIEIAQERPYRKVDLSGHRIAEIFASNVFTEEVMRSYLSKEALKAIKNARNGEKISREYADQIAAGMKAWAMEKGASHFTHWFQPLTGSTAEKHDSFFEPQDGKAVTKFSGNDLVQQEPDASSLPSGGLRNTFEARGYTAWDPSSPVFVYENTSGKTLCIPTVFVSYNGEALDYKAPLLKSLALLDSAATAVSQYFDPAVETVQGSLGIEQEYFLVDRALYTQRPDLIMCGRTLFGYSAAKNQQMEDHYFGSIPDRVFNYMYELEIEAHKLGIPLRTRHNEVAPGQYECAPQFEEINLAVDHNQLLMDLMDEVAAKHGFKVLLHEKPFMGINGSGKHNNWSMVTNTGVNLLSPGNDPDSNLSFLTFFINTIKAVCDHADLLRASIASASNDHRLGANEAPPAIISIFIGSTLTKVLNALEQDRKSDSGNGGKTISIAKIPEIMVDNTDRNRTSPFAFTGNKFELRAVGSSQNSASPMTALNTAVANQLIIFKQEVDALIESENLSKEQAIIRVLRKDLIASKKVLFEGNGYSQEWVEEAERRGLANIKDTPSALAAMISPSTVEMMERHGILSATELHARYEIQLEDYHKKIQIEGRLIDDMAYTRIFPPTVRYQSQLAQAIAQMKQAGMSDEDLKQHVEILEEVNGHFRKLKILVDEMVEERKKANKIESSVEKCLAYCNNVKSRFDDIRYHADKLERLIDDNMWEFPKYRELLYIK